MAKPSHRLYAAGGLRYPSAMKSTTRIDVSYLCKSVVTGAVAVACFAGTRSAEAQSLGREHDLTIAADRLFGFYGINSERDWDGVDEPADRNMSSLGFAYQQPIGLYDVPRLGIDFFIISRLSLGGSLGLFSYDTDVGDNADVSGLVFAPRVGYVFPFNAEWGIWPRGGFTYASRSGDDEFHSFAFTLEALFFFMPSPAFGFTAGPVLDLGVTGAGEAGPNDYEYSERLFGLAFGMFVRF